MSEVRVHNFSVSLEGFAAGEGQTLEAPFGHAGTRLVDWAFHTRTFRAMFGMAGGGTGVDEAFAGTWNQGIGAEIMGRNKFGPQRGPWIDDNWIGRGERLWDGLEGLEERFGIEAVNAPSGVTHFTFTRRKQ